MTSAAGQSARSPDRGAPGAHRLTRPRAHLVSGVSQGLAEHLGWSPVAVRWAFALSSLAAGAGALLYLWLWALTPVRDGDGAESAVERRLPVPLLLVGLGAVVALVSLAVVSTSGHAALLALTVPIVIVLGLGAVAWPRFVEPPPDAETARGVTPLRVGVGGGLVILGFVLALTSMRPGAGWLWLLVVLIAVAVAAVGFGPEALALRRDLSQQRTALVRDEQRAEIAAHLHDSVLQTLALIQNRAGASSEVARIARAQERELRDWLFAGAQPAERDLATELRGFAAVLELDHAARIEVVAVGEGVGLGPGAGDVGAAAREAMLNAARHAGGEVSVYLETSPEALDVFVRDRGPGFVVDDVPEDRLGVRESILGRMRRAGGSATVRPSASGVGTEVHLHLDRERSDDE